VRLACPECEAQIVSSDINLDRMVAKCAECNAVFGFDEHFKSTNNVQTLNRLAVPRPNNIVIEQTGTEIVFSWRWFTVSFVFVALFAVFWNGFMAVWFGIAIMSRIWTMAAFGSLHAAVGLFIAYMAIAGFVNTTRVRVGMGEISIAHGPLPWRGNRTLETASIAQLYTKENLSRNRRSSSLTYEVHAATRDGRSVKLLSGLETSEQALFLEQEIERYLQIKNIPVPGELGR
jgi:predicted Zn finger-like uncharacterized protein